ncbi:MAG: D-glycero-beta-D-manno-heptose 1-phosphate adenylyltransferase [Candidatus Omnitrophica bacterium]|nr:D-glycero-beta-D-manno-heptose 1-phosphate adenylyltransferase [Candidatus Omnitrophota bacterium]MDD5670636.1 D-glycero-beta-D-manno-heptose 1-phosphate adenylyltransferase [Candidatus Omnitrophota bacterium]
MKKKIIATRQVPALSKRLKTAGKKIVFTNGTFDILHLGHVDYLQRARASGDVLVVGVNTDKSVKSYKTPDRPINPEGDRIRVLTALACVDYAVLFNEPTPLKLILALKPDVMVKGADWKKSQIAGAKEVESWGGKIKRIRLVPGRSTTKIIRKIRGE